MKELYINNIYYKDFSFSEGFLTFCYENCEKIILEYKNIKYPEFYINSYFALVFRESDKSFLMGRNFRSLMEPYEKNVIRKTYEKKISSKEQVFKENIEFLIKNDEPIIVSIDTFYMKYATNYLENHSSHCAIFCGYDLINGVVYLIDWYAPWFFKGEIPINDFLKARDSANLYDGSLYSGKEVKNTWAFINTFDEIDSKELVKQILEKSIEINSNSLTVQKEEKLGHGLNGILMINDFILSCSDYIQFQNFYKNIQLFIPRYSLFCEILRKYASIKRINSWEGLFSIIENLKEEWFLLSKLVLKRGLKPDSEIIRTKISGILDGLYNTHAIFFDELEKVYGSFF